MTRWERFLASLATSGGNLFIMSFFFTVIMAVAVILLLKNKDGAATTLMVGLTGNFATAVVAICRGERSVPAVPPPDSEKK